MIAVVQRVNSSSVTVSKEVIGEIDRGLMILLGIEEADHQSDIAWLAAKITNLRIFDDNQGVMNLSIKDIDGEILLISQFTLHASTKKGNRPSYIKAAKPDIAIPMYEEMQVALAKELGKPISTGQFGADMKVSLINDGPVTIIIDSKNKV
jgi:D-tyrosyl-tRNA(Tyr) deacylase